MTANESSTTGDENRLARARKPRDPKPDHRLEKRLSHRVGDILKLPPNAVGNACDTQSCARPFVFAVNIGSAAGDCQKRPPALMPRPCPDMP